MPNDFYRRLASVRFTKIDGCPGSPDSERYLLDAGPHLCLISVHTNKNGASVRLRSFQTLEYNGAFDEEFNPLDEGAEKIIKYIEARERRLIQESASPL